MNNVGILCRGKSLERLPEIAHEFDTCFIINDWNREMKLFEELLRGKKITHFVNADPKSTLDEQTYARLRIYKGIMGWTELHTHPGMGKKNIRKKYKMIKKRFRRFEFIPDKYYKQCNILGNSGLLCILYASEVLKPKTVWIAGLDFYAVRYLTIKRTMGDAARVHNPENVNRLTKEFVNLVKQFPDIAYKLITYHDGGGEPLPENVEVL